MFQICKTVISHLATNLGITIIRKDQGGKKPDGNYAAYKRMTVNSSAGNNKEEIANPDPAKITYRYSKVNSSIVSLSFYSLTGIDEIETLAMQAIDFLQVSINDLIRSNGYLVQLFDVTVTDRTIYLDPIYEYSVGFDFVIKAEATLDKTVDAVDLDATADGVNYEF